MERILRCGREELLVLRRDEPCSAPVLRFPSWHGANALIGPYATRFGNDKVIRDAMTEGLGKAEADRLAGPEVLDLFLWSVLHGGIRLARRRLTDDPDDFVPPLTKGGKEEPPPPPGPRKKDKKKTWIKFKVVDDRSHERVAGVRLRITTPDGVENFYTTTSEGMITIEDLDPGTCDAACDLKDARLADTLDFVAMGEPSGEPDEDAADNAPGGAGLKRIAIVDPHKVKTGESIKSLADAAGLKWQDLAKFNWDTDVPDAINKHLRGDVGCTKKTADGNNYVFDDSDKPGIVYIPKKWEKTGLDMEKTHVIRVKWLAAPRYRIRLLDRFMAPIPNAPYRLTLAGTTRTGRADDGGWIEVDPWLDEERCHLEWNHPDDEPALAPAGADGPESGDEPSVEDILQAQGAEPGDDAAGEQPLYLYQTDLYLDLKDGDESSLRRLHNLGYSRDDELTARVLAFQLANGKQETRTIDEIREDLHSKHDACAPDKWPCPRHALWLE